LLAQAGKLGVTVGMIATLQGLAVGLQAVLQPVQRTPQPATDPVAQLLEFSRQVPQALAGPAQGRFRVATVTGSSQTPTSRVKRCRTESISSMPTSPH
jgi:hypothetical protein